MNIEFFLQLLINGLSLGAFYATMALGFSTIWGMMRLINLAHGEFLTMGAFIAWFFYDPLREQKLSLSSDNAFTTLLVMVLIALLLGLIFSESVLEKNRFPSSWLWRGVSLLVSFVLLMSFSRSSSTQVSSPDIPCCWFLTVCLIIGFNHQLSAIRHKPQLGQALAAPPIPPRAAA